MGLSTTLNSPGAQAATAADPQLSSVLADTTSIQVGSGRFANLTATARDSGGSPLNAKTVSFAAVDQNGASASVFDSGSTASCTTTSEGTCTVRAQPRGVAGVKMVTVRIDGQEISGSPYLMSGYSADGVNSTISFSSPEVRAGEPAPVVITVKNNNAPVNGATVNLHCTDATSCSLQGADLVTVASDGTSATCVTGLDGTCHADVTLSQAKLYPTPVWGSYFAGGSGTERFFSSMLPTVDLRDKVVTAAGSSLTLTPAHPQSIKPGSDNTFTAVATVKDQTGWPVGGKNVNFRVTTSGGDPIDPAVTTLSGGSSTGVGTMSCSTSATGDGDGVTAAKMGACAIKVSNNEPGTLIIEAFVDDEATDGSQQPISGSGQAMGFLRASSINGDIPVKPTWTLVKDWKAVWQQPTALSDDSVYWTSDWSFPNNDYPTVGDQVPMLGESVMSGDASSFTTRNALSFERTLTQTQNGGIQTFSSAIQFSTQAMAPVGGETSGAPMSVYFWPYSSERLVNSAVLDCRSTTVTRPGFVATTVVRVTDQSPDIYVGCMPVPNSADNYSGYTGNQTTGGEGNQLNGLIYIQTNYGDLDNRDWPSTAANTSNVQFGIWDPVDGNFVSSNPIQPADTKGGGTSMERSRLTAQVNNSICPTGLEGSCTHSGDVQASADFGLDAQGNIFMLTSSGFSANVNMDTGNPHGTTSLVRIAPTYDASGSIIAGTLANPWSYSVIQKPKKTDPSMRMNNAAWAVGTGINSGKLLAGGYIYVDSSSWPTTYNTQGTIGSMTGTASRMVRIDPLSGSMDIIGPSSPSDNEWVTGAANRNGGRWVMSQPPQGGFRDNASPQMLTVIEGYIYNDANGDGVIADTEKAGVPDINVAVYDEGGVLQGQAVTDTSGRYTKIVSGAGTYHIRLAHPRIDGVNAVQTYGAAGADSNTETLHCVDDSGTIVDLVNGEGVCRGAKTVPYVDPPVGNLHDQSDSSTWPIYATVTMNGNAELGRVDFGITTQGSYGDAPAGPATVAGGAPAHVQGLTPSLWLGQTLGNYSGPVVNASDHNGTDDGVFLQSYAGNVPLQDALLASTKSYNLISTVSGSNAANAKVVGWTTGTGNSWRTAATDGWKPSLAQKADADGVVTYQATGPFKIQQSGAVSGTPRVQLRAQVSSSEITLPTNGSNQYQANPASSTQSWTTSGEIEDYTFTAADAVYRVAATTTRGTGDGFVIDSQTLSAAPGAATLGVAKAASSDQVKTVTTTAPAGWQVTGAAIKNLEDGAPLNRSMTFTAAADNLSASIGFTPQLGDDLVVELTYVKDPGTAAPDHSSLSVSPDPGAAGHQPLTVGTDSAATYTATTTVHDGDDVPVPGQTVTYTIVNADGSSVDDQATVMTNAAGQKSSRGALTCTSTDPDGDCAVTVTSTKAGQFTLTSTIADANAGGAQTGVVGSPVTLDWKAGGGTPNPEQCAPGAVRSNLTLKNTAGDLLSSTDNDVVVGEQVSAIAYVTDDYCNPVGEGVSVSFTAESASGDHVLSSTNKATNADSLAIVQVGDSTAETVTVHATLPDGDNTQQDISGSPADVEFTAGEVCVVEAGCAPTNPDPTKQTRVEITNPDAKTLANGSDAKQIKVYAFDKDGNPVTTGVAFELTTADTALALPGAVADGAGAKVTVTTGTTGTATLDATSLVAGAHQARAAVGGVELTQHGSPLTMVFSPGEASASNSSLSVATTDANGAPVTTSPGDQRIQTVAGQQVTATVKVADSSNNALPGARVTLTVNGKAEFVNSTDGPTTTVCYTGDGTDTNGDGTADSVLGACSVVLTDSTAETIDLHATVGPTGTQVDVVDSPTKVTFTVGSISATNSTVEVSPTKQTAGTNVTVSVTVLDENENPVNNLTEANFALTGTAAGLPDMSFAQDTSLFSPMGGGVYTFQSTSSLIGTFTIAATVKGVALDQKPTVTFVSGGVCVVNCDPVDNPETPENESNNRTRFETLTNGAKADGQAADRVKAFAYDGLGNPVDKAAVVITDQTSGQTPTGWITPAIGTADTGPDGTVELTFTSETARTYSLKGAISTLEPATAALSLSFVPTEVKALRSSLKVEPSSAKVGLPVQAIVTARDENNNPVGNVRIDFSADSGAVDFYTTPAYCMTATSGANLGSCDVALTSKHAGTYAISAAIGTETVGGPGNTAAVTFTVDDICFPDRMVCTPTDNPSTPTVDESKNLTRVSVTKDGAFANDQDRDEVTAYSYDKYGNGRINDVVTTTTTQSDLTIRTPEAKTLSDGTAVLGYTSSTSSDNQARVFINGTEVKTAGASSPVTLHFSAGKGDPGHSSLTITPTTPQPVDSSFTLKAMIKDAQDNPVEKAVVSFVSSDPTKAPIVGQVDDSGDALPSCSTDEYGSCSVTVTSKKAGSYSIQATIPDDTGAPTQLATGSPATAIFTAKGVCLESQGCQSDPGEPKTRVEVLVNGMANDGVARDVVTVFVHDEHGNPIKDALVTSDTNDSDLTTQAPWDASNPESIRRTGDNGQTTIWYTSTVAGDHSADILVDGGAPKGTPVNLQFGNGLGDASKSSFAITPMDQYATAPLKVGSESSNTYQVTATIRDAFNQPVGAGSVVNFANTEAGIVWGQVSNVPSITNTNSCVTDGSGTCSAYIHTTKAGTYTITAKLNGDDIGSAQSASWRPDDVCVQSEGCPVPPDNPNTPGVDESQAITRVEVTRDDAPANGSVADIVTVFVHDQYGNPLQGKTVTTDRVDGTDTAFIPGLVANNGGTNAQGMTTIPYTSTASGPHHATVSIDNRYTPAYPDGAAYVTVNFVHGTVNADTSDLMVAPTTQVAGQDVTVTVTVKDAESNPINALKLEDFHVSGQSSDPNLPALTFTGFREVRDGVYTFATTSTLAGEFAISGSVSGVGLTQVPTVTFTAGAVCVNNANPQDPTHLTRVEMGANDQVANGIAKDTATVYAYDCNGNPVEGVAVVARDVTTNPALVSQLTPGLQGDDGSITSDDKGMATIGWSSKAAGTYAALVTVDTLTVTGSNLDQIRFGNDQASATRSLFEVTPTGSQEVNSEFTLKATLRDGEGNPVPETVVSFGTQARFVDANSCETDEFGVCSVTVTSSQAGLFDVSATTSVGGTSVALGGDGDASKASPQQVRFTPGQVCIGGNDVCPAQNKTHAEVVDDNQPANGGATGTIRVYAYDADGNPVPGASVKTTDSTGMTGLDQDVQTGDDGTFLLRFTSTLAGRHTATITIDGRGGFPGASSVLTFVHTEADWTASSLTISPNTGETAVGAPQVVGSSFTVTASV
ncbi:MAG: Ig-like domain-containing protein, partial [Propionibacteriaceae bacterium]|nr:Ig-like domain-containing protein [Propionibacteriaceae bacterium]